MNLKCTIYNNKIVITVNNFIIDDKLTDKILKKAKNYKIVGLNMKNVRTIHSKKFILALLSDKFKLFNLQDETLVYLSIILKEGPLKSYINQNDFIENKRELIKRRFLVA